MGRKNSYSTKNVCDKSLVAFPFRKFTCAIHGILVPQSICACRCKANARVHCAASRNRGHSVGRLRWYWCSITKTWHKCCSHAGFVATGRHAGAKVPRWRSQAGTKCQDAEVRLLGFNQCRLCPDGGQCCICVALVQV